MTKRLAQASLAFLLSGGLWLALKPTSGNGNRRLTFLPVHWSEYIDLMDFWFNLAAFALLAATACLALVPANASCTRQWHRAAWLIAIITALNLILEALQTSIPGRAMDMADVWAGLLGCMLGTGAAFLFQRATTPAPTPHTPPRVLFVDQTGKLGGAELMLLDLAAARATSCQVVLFQEGEFRTALEENHVATHVFPLGHEAAGVDKQAGLIRAARALPSLLSLVLKLASTAHAFDVVYANTAKALIIAGPASWLAGRKLVYHLHDIISAGHFSRLNRQALVWSANTFAHAVIANSQATQESFIRSGGRASLCSVIPNGFKIQNPAPTTPSASQLRADFHIPDTAWVILMAGRLTEWKGQKILLQALRQVPEAHAIFLGDALFTAEDRAYAEELHTLAEEPALHGRVHFAGFRKDTHAFFQAADVVVHASIVAEPFGRVIVEGMLAARPVIATQAGGAAEIIQHEQTGLLVPPGDVAALAAALQRLKGSPTLAQALAQAGQQQARTTYRLEHVQAQTEAVIHSVVHASTPSTAALPQPA